MRTAPVDELVWLSAHGRRYCMEAQPGKITRCVRAGRPYEAPLLEHIFTQEFEGVAVDAGANFGNHTLWMAVMCGLHVEAFEPIQHQVLARNVAHNGLDEDRVRIHPVALGAAAGTATHVAKGTLDPQADGTIPVATLDSFDLHDVAVIKADVEDMEPAVLAGGEQTIRRDRPVIFAEAHPGQHDKIAAVLKPWGYTMTAALNAPESTTPVERWDP